MFGSHVLHTVSKVRHSLFPRFLSYQRENFITVYSGIRDIAYEKFANQVDQNIALEKISVRRRYNQEDYFQCKTVVDKSFILLCNQSKTQTELADTLFLYYKTLPTEFLRLESLGYVISILHVDSKIDKASLLCTIYVLGLLKSSLTEKKLLHMKLSENELLTFENVTLSEASIIAGSYYKSGILFGRKSVLTLLESNIYRTPVNNLSALQRYNIVTIIKSLRLNRHFKYELCNYLKSLADNHELNLAELGHLLAYFANGNHYDSEFFHSCMSKVVKQLGHPTNVCSSHPSTSLRVKDLARCLWAASHVNYEISSSVIEAISEYLNNKNNRPRLLNFPETAIDIALSLAIQGTSLTYIENFCLRHDFKPKRGKKSLRAESRFKLFRKLHDSHQKVMPIECNGVDKMKWISHIKSWLPHGWKYGYIIPEIKVPGFYCISNNKFSTIELLTNKTTTIEGEKILGIMKLKLKILEQLDIINIMVSENMIQEDFGILENFLKQTS